MHVHIGRHLTETSRPDITGNPRCKNITAKSLHLTSLYPTALTSANDPFQCFTSLCLYLMQNYAAIRRFELFSLFGFLFIFALEIWADF